MSAEILTLKGRGSGGVPHHLRPLLAPLERLTFGRLRVEIPDGSSFEFGGTAGGPLASIALHHPLRLMRRLATRGDIGFAESYMAGEWSSTDLAQLLYVLAMNSDALHRQASRALWFRLAARARHALRRNSLRGSRRNISHHYDLGNAFYGEWLDASMTYSAACFGDPEESLEAAQRRKYERLLDALDPAPGEHILEIGCGWGGFAEVAAQWGMGVTGITLSREQLAYARARMDRAGLADRVDLRLLDYRQVTEQFDHVVSIEMFEAVGQAYWREYFATLRRVIKSGGRAALQVITIDEQGWAEYSRNPGGFIQTYIFPGGMLPTRSHLRELAAEAGFDIELETAFGLDYAETLRRWHERFNDATAWLDTNGYDERFRRMWRYYLAFCEAGFRARQIDVVQMVLEKP